MAQKKRVTHTLVINEWYICMSFLWLTVVFLVAEWLYLEAEVTTLKAEVKRWNLVSERTCGKLNEDKYCSKESVPYREFDRGHVADREGGRWMPRDRFHGPPPGHQQMPHHQDHHLFNNRPPGGGVPGGQFHGPPPDHQNQHTFNNRPPGEWGGPVITDPARMNHSDRQKLESGKKKHSFNVFASDLISVRRQLPDVAGPAERALSYHSDLPDVGVVIIFHNEPWSTLIRTVHSVIDRTSPHLLKEIILVDDFSDLDDLGERLEKYVTDLPKVKLLRATKRQGLIRARLMGFEALTAKVAMFLDAHCECTEGWLEPLLDRIARDPQTVAVPVADRIHYETMEFTPGNGSEMYCGFEWDMTFVWRDMPERERLRRPDVLDPVRSPTFLGCCFAISADFFNHIGRYDTGFDIWGAEHLELSFKTWMCGGKLEIVPCSHVGHLFRSRLPFSFENQTVGETVRHNNARLAEVWLNNYKHFFYDRIYYQKVDFGDVTERHQIRIERQCKSFDWYIENVYPELYTPYDCHATGQVMIHKDGKDLCLRSDQSWWSGNRVLVVEHCSTEVPAQHWTLTRENQIRRGEGCLTVDWENKMIIIRCHFTDTRQIWSYRDNNSIYHKESGLCLELPDQSPHPVLRRCMASEIQTWRWQRRTLKLPDSHKTPDFHNPPYSHNAPDSHNAPNFHNAPHSHDVPDTNNAPNSHNPSASHSHNALDSRNAPDSHNPTDTHIAPDSQNAHDSHDAPDSRNAPDSHNAHDFYNPPISHNPPDSPNALNT